jgi:outer membrane protein TolC
VAAVIEAAPCPVVDDPFAPYTELPLPVLIDNVLARNRSLAAMLAAWQAAAQRYPQVVSLEDPMFSGSIGPESLGSRQVEPGYMLEVGQKIPWPGKQAARGRVAGAEANAAWHESLDTRLQIVQAAQTAFYDYYLVARLMELNSRNLQLVTGFRDTAQARYVSNLVPQQDVLSAELELLDLQRRSLELRRMQWIAIARINTLLHRPPDFPLPPPPAALRDEGDLPPPELLRQTAIERRPDLAMLAARIRAEQANLALAYKEYFPDAEFWYRYDGYWQPDESDLRSQVGMNVNVPVYQHRRHAAVREAMFRIGQRRAELEQRVDDVMNDVQAAAARVGESQRTIALYREHSLPVAEQAIESARAAYITGGIDFLRLLEAQRRRVVLQEQHAEAVADYFRRLSELERATGGPLPRLAPPEELPAGSAGPGS